MTNSSGSLESNYDNEGVGSVAIKSQVVPSCSATLLPRLEKPLNQKAGTVQKGGIANTNSPPTATTTPPLAFHNDSKVSAMAEGSSEPLEPGKATARKSGDSQSRLPSPHAPVDAAVAKLGDSKESFFRRFFSAVARVRQVMSVPEEERLENICLPNIRTPSDPSDTSDHDSDSSAVGDPHPTGGPKPTQRGTTADRAVGRVISSAPHLTDGDGNTGSESLDASAGSTNAYAESFGGQPESPLAVNFGRATPAVLLEAEVAWAKQQLLCDAQGTKAAGNPSSPTPDSITDEFRSIKLPSDGSVVLVGTENPECLQSKGGIKRADTCAASDPERNIQAGTISSSDDSLSCLDICRSKTLEQKDSSHTGVPETENSRIVPLVPSISETKAIYSADVEFESRMKELHRLDLVAVALRCIVNGTSPPLELLQRLAVLIDPEKLSRGTFASFPRILELLAAARAIRLQGPLKRKMLRRLQAIEGELLKRRQTLGAVAHNNFQRVKNRAFSVTADEIKQAGWETRILRLRQFQAAVRQTTKGKLLAAPDDPKPLNDNDDGGSHLENDPGQQRDHYWLRDSKGCGWSSGSLSVDQFLLQSLAPDLDPEPLQPPEKSSPPTAANTPASSLEPATPSGGPKHFQSESGDGIYEGLHSTTAIRLMNRARRRLVYIPGENHITTMKLESVLHELSSHAQRTIYRWKIDRTIKRLIAFDAKERTVALFARQEQLREKLRRERMRLLKANDFDKYLELVRQSKNARIEQLLGQTERFLESISRKMSKQRQVTQATRQLQAVGQEGTSDNVATSSPGGTVAESVAGKASAGGSYNPMVSQPKLLIGGDLMPYQLTGLQFLAELYKSDLSGILADEMGLGKTVQTIAFLAHLMEEFNNAGPHLVIVPLSTLPNWVSEFERWCPALKVVELCGARREERARLIQRLRRARNSTEPLGFNVCLTTFDWALRERRAFAVPVWSVLVVDEGHRLKNARSKFHCALTDVRATHRLLLTGTPLQNNLTELWSLLSFILPEIFTSAVDFEQWFSEPFKDFPTNEAAAELSEEEKFLIINRLHAVLRPFLLRRVKADVLAQLPEKREFLVRIPLSAWQRIGYSLISSPAVSANTAVRSLANTVMQLRKLVNHPYLFVDEYDIDENLVRVSGKFEVLDRMLPKLIRFNHKVLIFCQMTQLMDILDDYLEWRGLKRFRLDGSISMEERRDLLASFNDTNNDTFIFVLSTRAGGLGLNLQAADTVIIFDSDWNPHQDLQAQARAHRLGQKSEVRVFRFVTVSGIEEAVMARGQQKLNIDEKIIQAGMFHHRASDEERQENLRMLLLVKNSSADTKMTTPHELNRFMARNEEEEQCFEQLDEEIFGADALRKLHENCVVQPNQLPPSSDSSSSAPADSDRSGGPCSRAKSRPRRGTRAAPRDARKQESPTTAASELIGSSDTSSDQGAGTSEEAFLVRANRLMRSDEVPNNWMPRAEGSADEDVRPLERSMRRGRSSWGDQRLSLETLSDAKFQRVVERLETGAAGTFEEALLLEQQDEIRRQQVQAVRRGNTRSSAGDDVFRPATPGTSRGKKRTSATGENSTGATDEKGTRSRSVKRRRIQLAVTPTSPTLEAI